jgi:carbonyl reductase 1
VSKVAVSALSFIQQRAFNADSREDLVVNAVHPGYVDTDMTSHKGPLTIEQGNHNSTNMYTKAFLFLHA